MIILIIKNNVAIEVRKDLVKITLNIYACGTKATVTSTLK